MNRLLLSILIAIAALAPTFAQPLWNREGKPDRSFGEGGYALSGPGNTISTAGSTVKPDGKVVWAHTVNINPLQISVVGQLENGDPDTTFGKFGFRNVNLTVNGWARTLAVQPDGKILIAGDLYADTQSTHYNFFVLRLSAIGEVDNTFGNDGMVMLDVPAGPNQISNDRANSLLVAPDGKITLAGTSDQYPMSANRTSVYAVLARLNANGSLDGTFGSNGVSKELIGSNHSFSNSGNFLVSFQTDGKIVGGLGAQRENPNSPGNYLEHGFVLRYLANGAFDSSFSDDGVLEVAAGAPHSNFSVVKQISSNHLLVLLPFQAQLVRLTLQGEFDSSFGFGGRVQLGPGGFLTDFNIAQDQKIVVSRRGFRNLSGGGHITTGVWERFWPDGSADIKFGQGGKVTIDLGDQDLNFAQFQIIEDKYLLIRGSIGLPPPYGYRYFLGKFYAKRKI